MAIERTYTAARGTSSEVGEMWWRSINRVGLPALSVCMVLLGMFIEVMAQSIQGTAWNVVELYGKPLPAQVSVGDHQPYLVFGKDGRMSGVDGCSWLTAPYAVTASGISFGTIAGTEAVCPHSEMAGRFRTALARASQWRIVMGRLEFYGASGDRFAVFEHRRAGSEGPISLNAEHGNNVTRRVSSAAP